MPNPATPREAVRRDVAKRLMAVHAHPDDESSKGAATYARYLADGAEVMVVSCTGGQRGDILNPAVDDVPMAHRDLPGLRRREMARAQSVIGFEHRWLGYYDSGLPAEGEQVPPLSFATIPLEISAEPLVRLIRAFRPHVVISYDENGGYPHPDHIRSHDITVHALAASGDAMRYPGTGAPWQVRKYYYDRLFSTQKTRAIYDRLVAIDPDSPIVARLKDSGRLADDRPYLATTRVDVSAHLDAKDAALRSHASQVEPDSPYFFWPNDVVRSAWPTDDYQLIDSKVPVVTPETDLFAGIPEEDFA